VWQNTFNQSQSSLRPVNQGLFYFVSGWMIYKVSTNGNKYKGWLWLEQMIIVNIST
jgi:hypothetical protein